MRRRPAGAAALKLGMYPMRIEMHIVARRGGINAWRRGAFGHCVTWAPGVLSRTRSGAARGERNICCSAASEIIMYRAAKAKYRHQSKAL